MTRRPALATMGRWYQPKFGSTGAMLYPVASLIEPRLLGSRHPGFGIESTALQGRRIAVRQRCVLEMPFCRLLHFQRDTTRTDPVVLVIPPLSGHFASLLRDMLAGLMPEHDLYVMDWIDASEVPVSEGDFDLDEDIAYIMNCITRFDGEVHVIGMCQSAMPALAANALLAAGNAPVPRSLTLFSGLIDPRVRPTRIGRLASRLPLSWFRQYAIDTVQSPFSGQGRHVYPASRQRTALVAYLVRHIATGGELLQKVLQDDGQDADRYPFLRLYLAVMDLPARFFLDIIRLVFHEAALARGRLRWRGVIVDPAALCDTALMTVEGELDDISAPGQTRVAQSLCPNIPGYRRRNHLQPGVGHFGQFHGRVWRTEVLPRLKSFIRDMT